MKNNMEVNVDKNKNVKNGEHLVIFENKIIWSIHSKTSVCCKCCVKYYFRILIQTDKYLLTKNHELRFQILAFQLDQISYVSKYL